MKFSPFILCVALLCSQQLMADVAPDQTDPADIERLEKTLTYIKQYAVQDVNDKQLLEHAMDGMVQSLDPHSTYLDPAEYKLLMENTQGEFSGLGIEVAVHHDGVTVVSALEGSPAQQAGITSGDVIVTVNGVPTQGMTLDQAITAVRGPVGSRAVLTLLRPPATIPFTLTLTRAVVHVDNVTSMLLEPGFGYIRIASFQENTGFAVRRAIEQLNRDNHGALKGLVLDLRNNPGGLLDAAVSVSDAFLADNKTDKLHDVIVSIKGKTADNNKTEYVTTGDMLESAPLVVLINAGSASASEVVAGALQDYKRAVIMGEKSFGKGSVQTIVPLDSTHAIKITTALYYTPAGRSIQATGITPDVIVQPLAPISEKTQTTKAVTEESLAGHLKNPLEENNMATPLAISLLAQKDVQLYEALNVLKALSVVSNAQ